MWTVISINWTAQPVTPEQLLVLRNVAARALCEESNPVINFSHDLCEGHITRGKVGVIGTFRGRMFTADLGTVRGEPWTVEFMLPRGTEYLPIPDDAKIISTRTLSDGKREAMPVEVSKVGVYEGFGAGANHPGTGKMQ